MVSSERCNMQGYLKALSLLLVFLFESEFVSCLNRDKITSMAQLLCPEGDRRICPTNNSTASMGLQGNNICCLDCSCDPSCTEYENCCFPDHTGNYPAGNRPSIIDNFKILSENDTRIVNECLYPLTLQPKDTGDKIKHQSFWMTSEVKDHGGPTKAQKCGLINVAPWGSLLPVSSKKTGHIYKNIFCAKENLENDEDVVSWGAFYVCDVKGGPFQLTETYFESCQVQFSAPRGIPVQRSSFCFQNLIDTCPEEVFYIPNEVTMNQTEVIDACTSGFLSPYREVGMYANIFCHICNGFFRAAVYKCRILSTAMDTKIGGKISGLIDYNYVQDLARENDNGAGLTESYMACLNKDVVLESVTGRCRPRFCPIGQIRDGKGRCFYAVSRLINVLFTILIQLKSEDPFLSIEYFQNLSDQNLVANFRSPLRNSFKIARMLYKPHSSLNVTNELLLYLFKKPDKDDLKQVVNFVRKNVKKKWLFIANNSTLTFSSSLSSLSGASTRILNDIGKDLKEIFRGLNTATEGRAIPLTNLYFCENVRLEPNEFNVSSQKIVFDKVSNRYLYHSEYSLVESEGQNSTCNICIDGSSFHIIGKNRSDGKSKILGAFYIILCVSVRCLMKG